MYRGKTLTVVLPTYAEAGSIRGVIESFFALGVVDSVLVVDNNAQAGTGEAVEGTGAAVIREPRQGFGYAVAAGLRAASADLVAVCEPDGTFQAGDLERLLPLAESADMVQGTRTDPGFIGAGADMGGLLRYGNIMTARVLSRLFGGPELTDVGCTLRLLRRASLEKILPCLVILGDSINAEMTALALLQGLKVSEVPVSYGKRVGLSHGSGNRLKCGLIACQMYLVMLYHLFSRTPAPRRAA
jgi:glycosyltransferase involved in cell wall biosynthesis